MSSAARVKLNRFIVQGWQNCLDVIFPRDCALSGERIDGDFRYLSKTVVERIWFAQGPSCQACGQPFYGVVESGAVCVNCRELEACFENGCTLFVAKGVGRDIIHALKYQRAKYLLDDIAKLMAECPHYLDFFKDAVLVPVPLHHRRERQRGYNQAQLLAEAICASVGSARIHPLLTRKRQTLSQTRLNRQQRIANVSGAFVPAYPAIRPAARRDVLIDDVFTTGATLNACASVLKAIGIQRVDVATLAHG